MLGGSRNNGLDVNPLPLAFCTTMQPASAPILAGNAVDMEYRNILFQVGITSKSHETITDIEILKKQEEPSSILKTLF